jgi:hypothetical protein
MKNLVVQVFFDKSLITGHDSFKDDGTRGSMLSAKNLNKDFYQHSQILAKEYAEKCDADYILFDKPYINFFNPTQERFRLIEEERWAEEYDNILYLDCDAFVYKDCPNLFTLYPQENLRVVRDMNPAIPYEEKKIVSECGIDKIQRSYFNAGVLLFHKSSLVALRPLIKYKERFDQFPYGDQSELNYCVLKYDVPHTVMDLAYNSFGRDAKIAHLYGPQKLTNKYHLDKAKEHAERNAIKVFYGKSIIDEWEAEEVNQKSNIPIVSVLNDVIMTPKGCLRMDGNIIDESIHTRGKEREYPSGYPSGDIRVDETIEEAYFIGYSSTHWGHYLTETLSRCHGLNVDKSFEVFYVGDISRVKKLFPQHNYIPLTDNFLVKKIHIPIPTMVNRFKILPEHIDFCREVGDIYGREYLPSKKLYLSRTSQPKHHRWTDGEMELEALLKKSDWKIVDFSKIPVSQQIGYLENAELVSGCIGSAFHNLMMTRKNPGKIIYLTTNKPNPNYALHDAILGNDSVYLDCQDLVNEGNRTKRIRNPQEVFEYLEKI